MAAADEHTTADIGDPSHLHSNRRQGQRILATVYDAVAGKLKGRGTETKRLPAAWEPLSVT